MLEASPFLVPFTKRLSENLADRIFKAAGLKKKINKIERVGASIDELEALRCENKQLRTYIFLILGILNERVERSAKGDPDNEV